MVVAEFGLSTWESILVELGVKDDATLLQLKQYDDATTFTGMTAVAKVLGIRRDDTLRSFGAHFVAYLAAGEHLHMLERMGDNLKEFLRNLNYMHYYLERDMRQASFPCFHVTDECDWSFSLSYASVRCSTLLAVLEGIMPTVAELLHGQTVKMNKLDQALDGYVATWRLIASAPSRESSTAGRNAARVKVADLKGAAKHGSCWHFALMGCCKAQAEEHELIFASPSLSLPSCEMARMPSDVIRDGLDALALKAQSAKVPADVLMRAVPCHRVCSRWEDSDKLERVERFWGTNKGDIRHFNWAVPAPSAGRFISHSWMEPTNWHEVMGSRCSYAEMKGTELQLTVMEIAEADGCKVEELTFWIDKCCIPQKHALMPVCISMIEDFLDRCDGMIVLLTWQYFERLWCVYEWATFLVRHPPENIKICLETFLRPSTLHLYTESIRNLTVDRCKCKDEADRAILKHKVAQYYVSEERFEVLARCSAIAMIARTLCRGASRGRAAWEEEYMPFVSLARELHLGELAEALLTAEPASWRREALREAGLAEQGVVVEVKSWQPDFHRRIDEWFLERVVPVVAATKMASVKESFIHLERKHSKEWACIEDSIGASPSASTPSVSASPFRRRYAV